MNQKAKIAELEMRAGAGNVVIGIVWQDKPDEVKFGKEAMTWHQWANKYPEAGHVKLIWETE